MANRIRTGTPPGFNKGFSLKFLVGSRVRQTPEEGRRTYQLKHCGNNNKDEDNSLKTLNGRCLDFIMSSSLNFVISRCLEFVMQCLDVLAV